RRIAEALAELLQAGGRAARLDDRRLEVRVGLAELLGDDVGVRQNRGRAGNVDLVAGRRLAGKRDRANDGRRRNGDKLCAHTNLPVLEVNARAQVSCCWTLDSTASAPPLAGASRQPSTT